MSQRASTQGWGFAIHAVVALVALLVLNYLIAFVTPIAVAGIESSYWIFFYHFPSAINCYAFFAMLLVFSFMYLQSGDVRWDEHARVAGEIGVLACTITLATGSAWARMAWGQWWVWDDPRLLSAAIMWLTYVGYVLLQAQVEDAAQRRRWAAVFGILAFVNIPIVHYVIDIFQPQSHPQRFEDLKSDATVRWTRWYGVCAFLVFYTLLYRWKLSRNRVRGDVEDTLAAVRRHEEGLQT